MPAIFWIVAIFVQSSISNLSIPNFQFKWHDKLAHIVEFAILAILLFRALKYSSIKFFQQGKYWLTFLGGSLYGLSDEIHQSFVPGRTADVYDWIADVIGILLIICFFKKRTAFEEHDVMKISGQQVIDNK